MTHFIYILSSEINNKYYVGVSKDPNKRLMFHNTIEKGFTARYRPWKLVFVEKIESKELAYKIEKYIKKMKSRTYIGKIIKNEYSIDAIIKIINKT